MCAAARRPAVVVAALVALLALAACSSSASGSGATPSTRTPTTRTPTNGPATTTSAPTDDGATADPSAGCRAAPTLKVGTQEIAVTSGGLHRVSDAYLPKGYSAVEPAPLIIDFHAFAPRAIEEGFSGLTLPRPDGTVPADRAGTIVLTPLGIAAGTTPAWNVAHDATWADDEQFAIDLLDHVEQVACVDTRRVYLTGFAIGAQMAAVVACDHADRVTAFAAVSGLYDPAGCSPSRAVPILAFHGTADPMIPYTGGIGPNVPKLGLDAATTAGETGMISRLRPIPAVVSTWVARDGCGATPTVTKPVATVTLSRWTGCRDDADIELYLIAGAGHEWPQSPGTKALESLLGPTSDAIPATDLMLAFFAEHRLPSG